MFIPMASSSEIFIDDILKKSLIFKEKRLDLIGRKTSRHGVITTGSILFNVPADLRRTVQPAEEEEAPSGMR